MNPSDFQIFIPTGIDQAKRRRLNEVDNDDLQASDQLNPYLNQLVSYLDLESLATLAQTSHTESPRFYRRDFYLSHAAITDSCC